MLRRDGDVLVRIEAARMIIERRMRRDFILIHWDIEDKRRRLKTLFGEHE